MAGLTGLWRAPAFRALSDGERTVVLYLLNGPQTNRIGCYLMSLPLMLDDLQRDAPTVKAWADKVWSTRKWMYDSQNRVLFIPTWWKLFPPASETKFREALKDLKAVPDCQPKRDFLVNTKYLPAALHPILAQVAAGLSPATKRVVAGSTEGGLFGDAVKDAGYMAERALESQVAHLWNECTTSPLMKVVTLGVEQKKRILARYQTFASLEYFRRVFTEINATSWCRGESTKASMSGWVADIRYACKDDETFQRFLDLAGSRQAMSRPAFACQHQPNCKDKSACTMKQLQEQRS